MAKKFWTCVLFAACSLATIHPAFAQERDIKSVLQEARKKNYVVGERTGNPSEMRSNVRIAAEEVRAYVRIDPKYATKADPQGYSPLVMAAHYGYFEVVEALLESPEAVASIDVKDARGLSAFETASHHIAQTAWVCQPKMLDNPFAFVPFYVQLPYYEEYDPYGRILSLLKSKGSNGAPTDGRSSWLSYCDSADENFRESVKSGSGEIFGQLKVESDRMLKQLSNKRK